MNQHTLSTLEVVILAAGKGTRMFSETPKVLHRIAGKAMLQHVVESAQRLHAHRIHLVVGFEGQRIRDALAGQALLCVNQDQQLGTGHAVMQALPAINDDSTILVLYGDVPLIRATTLAELIARTDHGALAVLTLVSADPTGLGRIIRDADGHPIAIVEEKDASAQQKLIKETNSGILAGPARKMRQWISQLQTNNAQGEYYLTDVIEMAVADGTQVTTLTVADPMEVQGINNRLQLAELERHYQQLRARELLLSGVTLADPARFDLRGELSCGKDVEIDINVIIEGKVTLGNRVIIGPNVYIKNATIGDDTQILANSHLDHVEIADQCAVGPYARLRPGTVLNTGSKIGNFVETKKAKIGAGSKVNHLSYIGDATLGKNVNVGAGTITCNYDGFNKFETRINDGVFVGSNTALVAPVTLGENVTIGAGSTITGDVPEGNLAVARSRQRNIDSWKRPSKK
jgi:bifunctional UDP-N-acetylglucosamine pyrophosphorylase / glucosamine-1-phosphate N-acetyltransferase